jgi:ethanolamine utilization protein EutQ (cupin superfamily)
MTIDAHYTAAQYRLTVDTDRSNCIAVTESVDGATGGDLHVGLIELKTKTF